MKTASVALKALLNSRQFLMADLFTFTLLSGTVLRYTNADGDLVFSGNTYTAFKIQRGKVRNIVGIEVDALDVSLLVGINDLVNGIPYPQFAQNGGFDGATLKLERIFMGTWGDTSAGSLVVFQGAVSDVVPMRTEIKVTVKSLLELLNINMPRNLYQPSCVHSVFDSGCGLVKASFAVNSSVASGSNYSVLNCGLAQSAGYFDVGTITMTSGLNNGIRRTVKSYTAGVINLSLPLPNAPTVGDTFTAYPGCDNLQATCSGKFNNLVNFRGFPYIPIPETAL